MGSNSIVRGILLSSPVLDRCAPKLRGEGPLLGTTWQILAFNENANIPRNVMEQVEVAYLSSDILGTSSSQNPTPLMAQFLDLLLQALALKWLQVPSAGVDRPVYRALMDRGVTITTAHGLASETVALSALTGLLALSRRMPLWIKNKALKKWSPLRGGAVEPVELRGQRVLILGTGHIGKEFARLAKAVGLITHGVRRRKGAPLEHFDSLCTIDQIRPLLPRVDWLVVTCPLTSETRGMIDADFLACLRPGAQLINVARGEIIDEEALISALRSERLAGAYLDVFATEPLPGSSPLWSMENVILSPHCAGDSTGRHQRIDMRFLDNLERYCAGLPLQFTAS